MKRLYEAILKEHFKENRQMVFLVGPRQVGKTTTSLLYGKSCREVYYFNWDIREDRMIILEGPRSVAKVAELDIIRKKTPFVIFDEIHKFPEWKTFLKSFFDAYSSSAGIIVTGSARLDILKKGGDSLMGRYFPYRVHPLSVSELLRPTITQKEIRSPKRLSEAKFQTLLMNGGFPEPFLRGKHQFYDRWKRLRLQQLIQEDVSDLSHIQNLDRLEVLAELLRLQVGQLTTFQSLSKKLQCSDVTVRNWITVLRNLFYCFELRPWSKNLSRSLLKEPKYFLWDWGWCEDHGARAKNFIASHLFKAIHFWTDMGYGEYDLHFLRDKEKREVDFLVTKQHQPWMMIEVKNGQKKGITPSLNYFYEQLQPEHAFQVVIDMPYIDRDCFKEKKPMIVPVLTFLSQLV